MAKTDWSISDVVRPQDMNDIGEDINQLRADIENIEVPPASTTQAGIVQLSNAINGTRENVAATEKAVGLAFQAGNERKAELVAALIAKGVAATTSETWAQLLAKVTALVKATGNATAAQVLSGATASNASGPITGTMPNQSRTALGDGYVSPKSYRVDGGGTLVIEPQTGYYTEGLNTMGFGSIAMYDPDFVSVNLPKDVDIFGVQGVLERLTTADRNAIISAINAKGVAASVADSNAALAAKVGQIRQGGHIPIDFYDQILGAVGTGDRVLTVFTVPAGTNAFCFVTNYNNESYVIGASNGDYTRLTLVDINGVSLMLVGNSTTSFNIHGLQYNASNRTIQLLFRDISDSRIFNLPANFETSGEIKVVSQLGKLVPSGIIYIKMNGSVVYC
ncbi:Phage tail fiber repeat protein [compost metagenome]